MVSRGLAIRTAHCTQLPGIDRSNRTDGGVLVHRLRREGVPGQSLVTAGLPEPEAVG